MYGWRGSAVVARRQLNIRVCLKRAFTSEDANCCGWGGQRGTTSVSGRGMRAHSICRPKAVEAATSTALVQPLNLVPFRLLFPSVGVERLSAAAMLAVCFCGRTPWGFAFTHPLVLGLSQPRPHSWHATWRRLGLAQSRTSVGLGTVCPKADLADIARILAKCGAMSSGRVRPNAGRITLDWTCPRLPTVGSLSTEFAATSAKSGRCQTTLAQQLQAVARPIFGLLGPLCVDVG